MAKTIDELLAEKGDLGDNLSVEDVMGREIKVISQKRIKTSFGPASIISCEIAGHEETILTWSSVLPDQLDLIDEELPASGVIRREGRYYTFA